MDKFSSHAEKPPLSHWKSRIVMPFRNNYNEELDIDVIEAYLEDVKDEASFLKALTDLKEHRPMDLASSDSMKVIKGDIEGLLEEHL